MVWRPKSMGYSVKQLEKLRISPLRSFFFFNDLCTQPQGASILICDVIRIYCLLHGIKPFLNLFDVCWRCCTQINLPVSLWVMPRECAPLSPRNDAGWCLSCFPWLFSSVWCVIKSVQGDYLTVVDTMNNIKRSLLGDVNMVFQCWATNHYHFTIAPRCACTWLCKWVEELLSKRSVCAKQTIPWLIKADMICKNMIQSSEQINKLRLNLFSIFSVE